MSKKCQNCGSVIHKPDRLYNRRFQIQKYCSKSCNPGAETSKRCGIKCPECGIYFEEYPSIKKGKDKCYCSDECRAQHIKRNSEKYNLFEEGHEGYDSSPWQGKELSEEHKKAISESLEGLKRSAKYIEENLEAENHWNWQGGKSYQEYGSGFKPSLKREIRARDKNKCRSCGKTNKENQRDHGKMLEVHHIDEDKTNNNPANLVTLCTSCHSTHHNSPNKLSFHP